MHLIIPKSKWFSSDKVNVGDIALFFIDENQEPSVEKWLGHCHLWTMHYTEVYYSELIHKKAHGAQQT